MTQDVIQAGVASAGQTKQPIAVLLQMLVLNITFWILALPLTILFAIIGGVIVTLFRLISGNRRRTLWLVRRTISNYGATIVKCAWPWVRVKYVDYSPEDLAPFVFVANHRSFSDGFLMSCLPLECVQVVNIWPFKMPLLGVVAKLAGYLSIREMEFDDFVRQGSRLLRDGASVIAFPEGTRSGSTVMGPFHSSAFRLAQHSGASIVPLAISGNEYIPRRGTALMRPGKIVVSKLPAITAQQYSGLSAFELKSMVRDRIQQHLNSQPV
jgi:1-acyl-sn-glycerol-3-phosphate acyltransferase